MEKRTRENVAEYLSEYEELMEADAEISQREVVDRLNIPRSTLRYWDKRKNSIDEDSSVVRFFESPAGVAFLHRLILALHFVFTQFSPGSIRPICLFLELTGLSHFVASSYGAQQKVSVAMEGGTVAFGKEERQRMADGMPHKQISVAQDETYHPETCLVMMDLDSNYIMVEKYASGRKAEDWTIAVNEATTGLNIEIIQSTSDEGTGIVCHVEKDLGVHHSPDLFHVQQDLVKGTSLALKGKETKAEKEVEKAKKEVKRHEDEKDAYYSSSPRPAGRPPEFDKRIEEAEELKGFAEIELETATERIDEVTQARRAISASYHPFDLETGAPRSADDVSLLLDQNYSTIEKIADEAEINEGGSKKIQKAKRLGAKMVATIVFFWAAVRAKIESLGLAPEVENAVYNHLIPGIYIDIVAKKAKTKEEREALRKKSEELLAAIRTSDGPFQELDEKEMVVIEQVAVECAQLFQRSSSCVEGRNGQLALRHHGLHRLTDRKLEALTVVHNFYIKRDDGTTPAERFFGLKPRDLFEYLLKKIDLPGRPARKRVRCTSHSYVFKNAA